LRRLRLHYQVPALLVSFNPRSAPANLRGFGRVIGIDTLSSTGKT